MESVSMRALTVEVGGSTTGGEVVLAASREGIHLASLIWTDWPSPILQIAPTLIT